MFKNVFYLVLFACVFTATADEKNGYQLPNLVNSQACSFSTRTFPARITCVGQDMKMTYDKVIVLGIDISPEGADPTAKRLALFAQMNQRGFDFVREDVAGVFEFVRRLKVN